MHLYSLATLLREFSIVSHKIQISDFQEVSRKHVKLYGTVRITNIRHRGS